MKKVVKSIIFIIGILVYSVCHMAFNPEIIFVRKYDTIDQQTISQNPDKDYRGYKAAEDITRVRTQEQLEGLEGYVTVETDKVIPLDLYVVKSFDVMNELIKEASTSGRKGRMYGSNRAPKPYLKSLGADNTHHNRAYLIQLEDGSYVTGLMEDYYAEKVQKGEKVTLPIAQVDYLQKEMKGTVKDYSDTYKVDTQVLLRFYNETSYEASYFGMKVARIVAGLLGAVIYLAILMKILPKGFKLIE